MTSLKWISEKFKEGARKFRYTAALATVALAVWANAILADFTGTPFSFGFLLLAIALTAWWAGFSAGILATIASIVFSGWMSSMAVSFEGFSVGQMLQSLTFLMEGLFITYLFQLMHNKIAKSARNLNQALEAKASLEIANQAKRDFIANMSHEIRTPLTSVLGFSDLLLNSELSNEEKENYVRKMKANASALAYLIDDILDISAIERGSSQVEKQKMPLEDFLNGIDAETRPLTDGKGLGFEIVSKGPVPRHISTDERKLAQILHHVIGNAIKYSEQGSIRLTITFKASTRKLAFLVKDDGMGIEPGQTRRLFRPFTQMNLPRARKFGSNGLGLFLSRRLARSLGGDLRLLASRPGRGSTFMLTIDTGTVDESNMLDAIVLTGLKAKEVPTPLPSLSGLKVLLVEDSPDTCMLVSRLLEMAGAVVETAATGREGLKKAELGDHNLVLMDIQLPEMDGNEAARELRQHHFEKPIVALSAHALKEDREMAFQSGFDDYVIKPVNRVDLISKVSALAKANRLSLGHQI